MIVVARVRARRTRPWYERPTFSQRVIVDGLRRGDPVTVIALALRVESESVRKSIWHMARGLPSDLPPMARVTVFARVGVDALRTLQVPTD